VNGKCPTEKLRKRWDEQVRKDVTKKKKKHKRKVRRC
jgi:hypothetical protein